MKIALLLFSLFLIFASFAAIAAIEACAFQKLGAQYALYHGSCSIEPCNKECAKLARQAGEPYATDYRLSCP